MKKRLNAQQVSHFISSMFVIGSTLILLPLTKEVEIQTMEDLLGRILEPNRLNLLCKIDCLLCSLGTPLESLHSRKKTEIQTMEN